MADEVGTGRYIGDIQTIKTLARKRETSFAVEQGIRHMLELKPVSDQDFMPRFA